MIEITIDDLMSELFGQIDYDLDVSFNDFETTNISLTQAMRLFSRTLDSIAIWHCLDCEVHCRKIDEYYMVNDNIWFEYVPEHDGMLCLGCLEERMQRKLSKSDFTDAPINSPGIQKMSQRYLDRLSK